MSRRLASYVHVEGQVYGPDADVPAEVAEKITNPKAWGDKPASEEKADAKPAAKKAAPAKKADAKPADSE